ncbi:P-loop containing nucleoside triphosphate hydrolase protein [Thamnocephalis sphaerospora]|uniref:P-loop containing nucleoside triphosphate hydrolase protein n=1 Tax=Thamnocephalis sphaerospora TaxID=78915 RepID=A0A4V1IVV2_9FUNG|nr:P-loop containing nucleoside triphosphate hydrolase protein [Thamnocephalis sphaerospora]|eukprot:RKP05349.1 P-loop containing nucleoside triphosphate hydrolase protein [Thamnocephalis sphaerospora]
MLVSCLVGLGASAWFLACAVRGNVYTTSVLLRWYAEAISVATWVSLQDGLLASTPANVCLCIQAYLTIISTARVWSSKSDGARPLARHQATVLFVIYVTTLVHLVYTLVHSTFDIRAVALQYALAQAVAAQIAVIIALSTRGTTQITAAGRIVTLEESASFMEWALFDWISPLLDVGNRRQISDPDLWDLSSRERAASAVNAYKQHKYVRPSMLRSLIVTFRRDLIVQTLLALLWTVAVYIPPLLMNYLLKYLENADNFTITHAWLCAAGLFLGNAIANNAFQQAEKLGQHMSIRARAIISHEVAQKCLRRQAHADMPSESDNAEGEGTTWDNGAVTNILNVDVQNICEMLISLPSLVGGPFQVVIAVLMLWMLAGVSTVLALGVLLLSIRVAHYLASKMAGIYERLVELTDERLSVIMEVLQSIRIVKFFAWEPQFTQRINDIRQRELDAVWNKQKLQARNLIAIDGGPLFAIAACMIAYTTVFGHVLTASVAFTSAALVNILRGALWRTPLAIMWATQARVSSRRISEFLALPETGDHSSGGHHGGGDSASAASPERIAIQNAEFCWTTADKVAISTQNDSGLDGFKLQNINIEFSPGNLNVIAGPTGSGKTSLLMALLGEMPCIRGHVHLPRHRMSYGEFDTPSSNIAFVAQQAWLQNVSIRNNILFGQPFDEARYHQVLHACALERDLEILDAGDRTQIGEKGVTLSGGQKQRVALARAVYSPARHIILDDCLSAVDAHTAKHIVEHCLLGPLMHGRTRILVTHQVDMCARSATFGVLLRGGHVVAQGPAEKVLSAALMSESGALTPTSLAENVPVMATATATASLNEGRPLGTLEDVVQADGALEEDEECAEGSVSAANYLAYMRAAGGYLRCTIVLLGFVSIPLINVLMMYILKLWTNNIDTRAGNLVFSGIFLGGCALYALLAIFVYSSMYRLGVRAGRTLHENLFASIIGAKMRFFDKTPIGRIMNRFSKDVTAVDQDVAENSIAFLFQLGEIVFSIIAVTIVLPWFLAVMACLAIFAMVIAAKFLSTARELKRLESVSKSPFLSLTTEMLNGVVTIRAFGMEHWFSVENVTRVDTLNRPVYLLTMTQQWLICRLQWVSSISVLVCCILAILFRDTVGAGAAGLALSYALTLTLSMTYIVSAYGRVEVTMNGMERISEYLQVEQEPAAIVEENRPAKNWPLHGAIQVDNLTVRYSDDQTPVLHGLTLDVKPGERIGIVGRTGAGKSTLSVALFRFIEAAGGRILIDDVDISKIGLRDLRSRLTIIPQDPVLFSGTIRTNLDPFLEHDDASIWNSLRRCHLIDAHHQEGRPAGFESLDAPVAENGSNFSHGQRQLLVMARALLRNSRVIIMDEATASVDFETDAKIQITIREEFNQATLLCIAHRLRTIIDYDRVLVLDAGRMVEYDAPATLIRREGGAFRQLCERSGELDALLAVVQDANAS